LKKEKPDSLSGAIALFIRTFRPNEGSAEKKLFLRDFSPQSSQKLQLLTVQSHISQPQA